MPAQVDYFVMLCKFKIIIRFYRNWLFYTVYESYYWAVIHWHRAAAFLIFLAMNILSFLSSKGFSSWFSNWLIISSIAMSNSVGSVFTPLCLHSVETFFLYFASSSPYLSCTLLMLVRLNATSVLLLRLSTISCHAHTNFTRAFRMVKWSFSKYFA